MRKFTFTRSISSIISIVIIFGMANNVAVAQDGISIEEITGNCRRRQLVTPRQIVMYLMREEIKASYPSIGQELGGRDHTTAIHACNKITAILEKDEKMKNDIHLIKQKFYQ